MNPRVSVIIPTYNRPQFLKRALASVQAQTFKDFEILVIQNGAENESREICSALMLEGAPVRYLHEPKASAPIARNLGILKAQGELIAFLDDDDVWLPYKLETEVSSMEANPDWMMSYSHPMLVREGEEAKQDEPALKTVPQYKDLIVSGCMIRSLSGIMLRRDCLKEVGLFNPQYQIANDFDLYLRMLRRFKMGLLNKPLFQYTLHTQNYCSNLEMGFKETIAVMRSQTPSFYLRVTQADIQEGVRHYNRLFCGAAEDAKQARDFGKAFNFYRLGLQQDPLIGLQIQWGRFNNKLYRIVRPYLAALQCLGFFAAERLRASYAGVFNHE